MDTLRDRLAGRQNSEDRNVDKDKLSDEDIQAGRQKTVVTEMYIKMSRVTDL